MSNVDSSLLKTVALSYLRYARRMPLVCTEVGRWNADVMGVSAEQSIEIEVKVSKADLKAEFKRKIAKQYLYGHATETSYHVPNTFYFLVPSELADFAKETVQAEAPKAGVLSFDGTELKVPFDTGCVSVTKRPAKLREGPTHPSMMLITAMRCSSELCGLYLWNRQVDQKVLEVMTKGRDTIVGQAARAAGLLDIEDQDALLERAKELAFAVVGETKTWASMTNDEHKGWIVAAKKLLEVEYVRSGGDLRVA